MAIYGENKDFRLIRCKDNDEWLQARTKGIGGSDVAALIGISPWASPSEIWLEKTGRGLASSLDKNPTVQFGNMMEQNIGDWFAAKHPDITVRRVNAICQKIDKPYAQASLDFECCENGLWGILEIKTARSQAMWNDGVPEYYMTQVQHYMYVTGRKYAYFAVFFRDSCKFADFYVERNEDYINIIEGAVDTFWADNVEEDTPPSKIVGTTNEAKALAAISGKSNGKFVKNDTQQVRDLIEQYLDASERESKAKADKRNASNKICALIKDNNGLLTSNKRVTWVRSERTTIDTDRLREEHPDIADEYTKTNFVSGGLRIADLKDK